MEPLSVLSVIIQLATASPQLDNLLIEKKEKFYTRTETIELYRKNMINISNKKNYYKYLKFMFKNILFNISSKITFVFCNT